MDAARALHFSVAMKEKAPAGEKSGGISLHQTCETMTLMKTYVI